MPARGSRHVAARPARRYAPDDYRRQLRLRQLVPAGWGNRPTAPRSSAAWGSGGGSAYDRRLPIARTITAIEAARVPLERARTARPDRSRAGERGNSAGLSGTPGAARALLGVSEQTRSRGCSQNRRRLPPLRFSQPGSNGDPSWATNSKRWRSAPPWRSAPRARQSRRPAPPGYTGRNGACYARRCGQEPRVAYAPNNPVSGAAAGASAGAAEGAAAAGPVGAIVGGALGTAGGALAGTANMVTGAPVAPVYGSSAPPPAPGPCPAGHVLYQGHATSDKR